MDKHEFYFLWFACFSLIMSEKQAKDLFKLYVLGLLHLYENRHPRVAGIQLLLLIFNSWITAARG